VAGSLDQRKAPDPAPGSWAAKGEHEVAIWVIEMEAGASWMIPPATKEVNRSLYFFEGTSVDLNGAVFSEHCALELQAHLELELRNGPSKGRFLLLQGAPINEPVVSYGPFVMNTRKEIQEAFSDYQETRFGGWPWPRHDQVHGPDRGRFARHSDGSEEVPAGG